MKKIMPMFLAAFAIVFCCACNAVTPGPSTTRSMAAQVSVSTEASKESSGSAQKPTASMEESTAETKKTEKETGEETEEETEEKTTRTTEEETEETTKRETKEETRKETKSTSSRSEEEDDSDGETVYVISAVNVRDAATKDSNVVGSLSAGDAVTKLSEDGGWTKILYDGEECYVSTSYLSSERQ